MGRRDETACRRKIEFYEEGAGTCGTFSGLATPFPTAETPFSGPGAVGSVTGVVFEIVSAHRILYHSQAQDESRVALLWYCIVNNKDLCTEHMIRRLPGLSLCFRRRAACLRSAPLSPRLTGGSIRSGWEIANDFNIATTMLAIHGQRRQCLFETSGRRQNVQSWLLRVALRFRHVDNVERRVAPLDRVLRSTCAARSSPVQTTLLQTGRSAPSNVGAPVLAR